MQFFSHMAVHSRRIKVRALLAGLLFGIFFNVNHSFATDKQPKLHKVVIEAMKFSPEKIEVNVGDTVVWENKDPFPHNVTANNLVFRSPEISSTKTWKMKINKAGVYTYICTFHPTMKATLVVN